jgi:hypothetical protein
MRRIPARNPPPPPWVKPEDCTHPNPVTLLKLRDFDETLFRCRACGKTLTTSELTLPK